MTSFQIKSLKICLENEDLKIYNISKNSETLKSCKKIDIKDVKDFVNVITQELSQPDFFWIVEANNYWHKLTFYDLPFLSFSEAQMCAHDLNLAKDKFAGWDHEYRRMFDQTFDKNGNLVEIKREQPKVNWKTAKKQMGCRYDGQHYMDFDFKVCNPWIHWRAIMKEKPGWYSEIEEFDLESFRKELEFFWKGFQKGYPITIYQDTHYKVSSQNSYQGKIKLTDWKTSEFAYIFRKSRSLKTLCIESILKHELGIWELTEDCQNIVETYQRIKKY